MNKKKKRNGFTIVELVIVIAVIGILAAVLIPTFSNLIRKAKQSADQQLVYHLNEAVIANETDNLAKGKSGTEATMYDTLQVLDKEYGFTVERMTPRSGNDIVWDSTTNRFALVAKDGTVVYTDPNRPTADMANKAKMWRITEAGESLTDGYSHYLTAGWTGEVPAVATGLDVGENDDITSVNYANDGEAQTAVIRTNSANTTLTIDDKSTGTINHYGSAGELNIIQCHTASYHENGKVAYAEIAKGRIVLEKGADVEEIHINKIENEQAFDTVIIANNGGAEELPERITRDAVEVSSQTLVVKVESNGSSENVYVYANGTTGTTEKVTEGENKQNEAVNSALGQLVLDNGSNPGEKAQTTEQKAEAKREIVNEALENTEYKGVAISKADEATQLMTIEAFRDAVNAGNTYAGYTVKLLDDIDLNNVKWTPIGTNEHPFSGIFDGQNHVISNFIVSIETRDAGLFGVVRGVHTASMEADYTRFWDETTSNLKFGSDSESHFETIIKNLTLKNVDVSTTQDYAGGLAGYTIDTYVGNVYVESGSTYATKGKVGGVIGSSNGFTVLNNLTTGKNLTVTGDKHTIGGIVANIQRGYSNGDHVKIYQDATSAPTHAVLVENCTNNATVVWDKNGTYAGGVPIAGVIGNSGSTSEPLTVVVYKCTNNGAVQAGKCSYASGIIGQSHTLVKVVYGCVNNGNITADAYYELSSSDQGGVAGITITGYASLIACSNTGTLINNHENGNVYDITSAYRNIIIEASNFESVAALQSEINSRNNDSCRAVVLKNITVTDIAGMLTLPTNIESIKANTKVCESVDLSGNLTNINMVGLNQKVAVTRTIIFSGSNCEIEVEENKVAGNIHLQGDNLSLTNNGTMGTLTYGVYGQEGTFTATNNGTMTGVGSVTGSSNMTLINNGTISREDWHTFDIETDGTLIVHNYGTIHGKNGNPYALLLYGGCDVTFYAHSGSIVEGGLAAYSKAHTVIIYADAGTTINGNPWSSISSKTYNVTVNQ